MLTLVSQTWRSWKNAKVVALLCVVALAVGIGSATAIYTVVNAVMLKPLPYEYAERFVALYGTTLTNPEKYSSSRFRDLQTYQQRTRSFDVFGVYKTGDFNLTSPGEPQHINGIAVTPSLARNLGVHPVIGQWFSDDTGAVISTSLWNRMGKDPSIVGKAVVLNGRGYVVTGVMPSRFQLPVVGTDDRVSQNDVWMGLDPNGSGEDPNNFIYFCYARRRPAVTLAQAREDVKRVAAEIAQEEPGTHPSYTARLDSLRDSVISSIRPTLLLLLGASGLLLLITAANVAGLLLARSVARARETAIRVSLGATQRQLALDYFAEALFVSLGGAVLGVPLSAALVRFFVAMGTGRIPVIGDITTDWTVFAFAIVAASLAGIIASFAPIWQARRTEPNEVLSDGARTTAGVRSRRLSRWLVIAEIAFAFALLIVCGVLIAHLTNLSRSSPGFDANNLLTFQVTIADSILSDEAKRVPYQASLVRALEAMPGVTGVTFANQLALDGCCLSTTIYPEGSAPGVDVTRGVSFVPVTPSYFQTLRIPLRSGRLLTEHDSKDDIALVVINEAAARHYWPERDAVGAFGRLVRADGSRFQVIGIVGNVRNEGLGKAPRPEMYFLSTIAPFNPMHFLVRSQLPPESLVPEIRSAVQSVDRALPIHHVSPMTAIVRSSLTFERLASFMTAFFAIAALVMATLGIYGVVAYSVRQRVVEMGTRMALGATGTDLLSLVLAGGLKMAGSGIAIGAAISVAATWIIVRAFSIENLAAAPFIASSAIVAAVAMAASFFPAWRATLLSPIVAIRNEPRSMWSHCSSSSNKKRNHRGSVARSARGWRRVQSGSKAASHDIRATFRIDG